VSVEWEYDTLTPGLRTFPSKLLRSLGALADYHAENAVTQMRSGAPWTDRTGNARQGLNANAFTSAERIVIVMYHQVPYGIWLEVRWSGRYRIIVPTVNRVGREFMTDCRRLMRKMR
jgi:hypothetical protein